MFGLGFPELLTLLIVGLVLAGAIFALVAAVGRVGTRAHAIPAGPPPSFSPDISTDLQNRVRALCVSHKKIHAIKLIRQETGLGLLEAKIIAEAVEAGRALPGGPARPDLAFRVRELKAAGRTEQAIFLVRGETGMGQTEAETFVNAI